MADTDHRLLLLHPDDNVLVLRSAVEAGEAIMVEGVQVTVAARIGMGHKLARRAIGAGEKVLKYGAPIGSATCAIAAGEHVHLTNLKSDYTQTHSLDQARVAAGTLCGQPQVYDSLPWFWSDQYDCKLQSAGLRLEHEHEIVRGNPSAIDGEGLAVFYLRGDRMIAADCVNRAKEFMACKRLIAERLPVNLAALADESLSPEHFEQTQEPV